MDAECFEQAQGIVVVALVEVVVLQGRKQFAFGGAAATAEFEQAVAS